MNPIATIKLQDGRQMRIELDPSQAPNSVKNFCSLAKKGFYDGLIFHRVIANFMIQGGGFNADMEQKFLDYTIKGEFMSNGVRNTLKHEAGVISMARTVLKNSANCQFFICVENNPHLDGEYAAFGRTADEESLKVAIDISKVKTHCVDYYSDVPRQPIVIETITVENADDLGEPEKLC